MKQTVPEISTFYTLEFSPIGDHVKKACIFSSQKVLHILVYQNIVKNKNVRKKLTFLFYCEIVQAIGLRVETEKAEMIKMQAFLT